MDKDRVLVQNILARDRRALESFYHTYTPKLRRHIFQKIDNPQDAEEVLQDTLYAFLESLRDFTGGSRLETYLHSIMVHKIIDYYRRKKIKHIVFSKVPHLEHIVSALCSPEEDLDVAAAKEKIHQVLEKLMPHYREILLNKYIDDMSVSQIAGKFAVSIKSVESQLFRARKAFVNMFLSL